MTASPLIQSKIIELCEVLVADGDVKNARLRAETFLADDVAVSLYREMATLGRALHQKQHQGEQANGEEITRFNGLQDRCEANPVITSFLNAQELLSGVAEAVNAFVSKTLESGRVPSAEEMVKKGGCGEGCGCH
ncbi:MAG: YlbF family regulator [Prosthecobacter sp.]